MNIERKIILRRNCICICILVIVGLLWMKVMRFEGGIFGLFLLVNFIVEFVEDVDKYNVLIICCVLMVVVVVCLWMKNVVFDVWFIDLIFRI